MSDIFGDEDIGELEQQARQADAEPAAEVEPQEEAQEPVEEAPVAKPMVSIDALHQARKEAQEARAKASELEKKIQGFDEMRNQLDEWRRQQQAQTQEREFDQDPLGSIRREIQDLKRTQEESQTKTQQQTQARQQAEELERAVAAQVQQYTQQQPDYPDALNHLMQFRAQELALWGASETEIPQMLEAEARQIAEGAMQSGRNPAHIVYEMAKLRGYNVQKKVEAKPTVERIERGQKAAQSLAGTQGEPEEVGLTDIAKMSDAEFDKFWEEMSRSATPRH